MSLLTSEKWKQFFFQGPWLDFLYVTKLASIYFQGTKNQAALYRIASYYQTESRFKASIDLQTVALM